MTVLERKLMNRLITELNGSSLQFQRDIEEKFPDLTIYEIRLCGYLKANLSTKEIATILNITPDSVKKSKHRLRAKLEISPLTAWNSFFRAINE